MATKYEGNRELAGANRELDQALAKATASGVLPLANIYKRNVIAVAEWMNGFPGDEIERLVLLLKEAGARMAEPEIELSPVESADTVATIQNEVYQILRQYAFYPVLHLVHKSGGGHIFALDWQPGIRLLPPRPPFSNDIGLTVEEQKHEMRLGIMSYLLEAVQNGYFDRLRRCEVCNKWFYANSLKKVVCSNTCRFRKYQSKQEAKEKKRDYMRGYFRNPKVKARLRRKNKQRAKGHKSK